MSGADEKLDMRKKGLTDKANTEKETESKHGENIEEDHAFLADWLIDELVFSVSGVIWGLTP